MVDRYTPKVGEVCSLIFSGNPEHTGPSTEATILYIDEDYVLFSYKAHAFSVPSKEGRKLSVTNFRKIKTEKEVFIETFLSMYSRSPVSSFAFSIGYMYDNGFRYLGDKDEPV